MLSPSKKTLDGNEATALVAHKTNEVIAIYPITPASPMGEHADFWSAEGEKNVWGTVPLVVEMQSEGGAAGAIHGALQGGALTTTFTASQGLLLMIPNMYKIAGELTPTVFHVAARSIAAQALSIFGDHSDVMATRATGFALLASNSVQEAHDFALIAQAATLRGRIPIIHFFDGFRTSHEVTKIEMLADNVVLNMLNPADIASFRERALNPNHPVVRGTSQNPDVFFQARETVNPYYDAFPDILQQKMDQFAEITGRHYHLFEYSGSKDAEQVIVLMGSGAETVDETVKHLNSEGHRYGVLKVRLFRPFDPVRLVEALPKKVSAIAILDRTKEPGARGEPLYKEVVTALAEQLSAENPPFQTLPKIIGGRFGLSSKEFTPGMVQAIFDELKNPQPKNHFTIGITDDVTHHSLDWDRSFRTRASQKARSCVFYGLGSDGTVSANKNSIKIVGDSTDLEVQGYFVYDSKKTGAVTISHLRFCKDPIQSSYLIGEGDADFIACHQAIFLERYDMLDMAAKHALFLLNCATPAEHVWDILPAKMQQTIIDKNIQFYCIDADKLAREHGMGSRINTIMQSCFFELADLMPKQQALDAIKNAVKISYGKKGDQIVQQNCLAIDDSLKALSKVSIPAQVSSAISRKPTVDPAAPEFVKTVTGEIIGGHGDLIPVSLLPADGTYPTGTSAWEKRNLADKIPALDYDLCTHCGKCVFVCPHSAIRSKAFPAELVVDAPDTFLHVQIKGKDYPEGLHISYQVAPEDCTGCSLCVDICPIRDKKNPEHKAINMVPQPPVREQERANWAFFEQLPDLDRQNLKINTMKGSMLAKPLFEFSGACSGCGETPYIRLASQLFGDRMLVANATGCSSIYGGNLPTTPWSKNSEGRGPAWNNSLFEDNAEFGLGIRLAVDKLRESASEQLLKLSPQLNPKFVDELLNADESDETGIYEQRQRVDQLIQQLEKIDNPDAQQLNAIADFLTKRSVWIIGGDGWAYDIGYGGLDHVLASGKNVNILVLDTEVYSNTGGQTSKATPRAASAKFSAAGKPTAKKDLARIAMSYESVYVAHVAYAGKDVHTLHTFLEAESFSGTSLIIAYAPCIAHGIDLKFNHRQQDLAVKSGHWPLFRYDPRRAERGLNPLLLDSKPPSIPYREYVKTEGRFNMLMRTHPEHAEELLDAAQHEITERYHRYEQLAALDWREKNEILEKKKSTALAGTIDAIETKKIPD
ncbi:MAG: pyruvate:ferredoxin (flavodoxin) oxidoreductase [Pseudomonadales bacterium]|nr:pyruvate:ferredoxin (flavodoxin) oxidoreductase [Pseudomonadales bacterium]